MNELGEPRATKNVIRVVVAVAVAVAVMTPTNTVVEYADEIAEISISRGIENSLRNRKSTIL